MNRLQRQFSLSIGLSLAFSMTLGTVIFFIPVNSSFKREARIQIETDVKLIASGISNEISSFVSATKSLGSRTFIRMKQLDHMHGRISKNELYRLVSPKYSDGASSVDRLVGARRYLFDGSSLTEWGNTKFLPPVLNRKKGTYLVHDGNRLMIMVVSSIEEKEHIVGFDACIFDTSFTPPGRFSPEILSLELSDKITEKKSLPLEIRVPLGMYHFSLVAHMRPGALAKSRWQALFTVIGLNLTLFLLISLFGYFIHFRLVKKLVRKHTNQNDRLTVALEEKDRLLKEVHHRIKNNISTIMSLLSLQSASTDNEEARSVLTDARERMRSMAVLYDRLYRSENIKSLSVREYLTSLLNDIREVFPPPDSPRITFRIDDCVLGIKKLSALGQIINELITNSMKYAFTGRDDNTISITVEKEDENYIRLIFFDNGKGFPPDFDINDSRGFGLMLVKGLSEQLEGTLKIENSNGAMVTLIFRS